MIDIDNFRIDRFILPAAIHICIASDDLVDNKSNALLHYIIANSTFTPKQISIISKRLNRAGKAENMTSGAYYRQVRQCKDKTIAVLYSFVLLELVGAIEPGTATALERVTAQMRVILQSENRDVVMQSRSDDVMSVMDQVMQRVCKL